MGCTAETHCKKDHEIQNKINNKKVNTYASTFLLFDILYAYQYNFLFMSPIITIWMVPVLQLVIAFGLINVWLVRFHRPTKYRGASAQNMKEEFSAYGLPAWSLYVVGFLKIMIAVSMIVTVLMPEFMFLIGVPALGILVILMCGAIAMHVKVRDSFIKTLPALLMLVMSLVILYMMNIF